MENQPQQDWKEQKRQAQTGFSIEEGSTIATDHMRMQRQQNAKFWENEILHEHLGDRTIDERNRQLDLDELER